MSSDQEPLVFHQSVPRLTDLSSFEVALEIWYTFISREAFHSYSWIPTDTDYLTMQCLDKVHFEKLFKQVELLRLPRHIEDLTKSKLHRVHFEMARYFDTLNRFFAGKLRQYRLTWDQPEDQNRTFELNPRWWVWRGNYCEIDHKKTALNLLAAPELTEVQKFIIMCQHRVVDDMTCVPLCWLPQKFIEEVSFEKNPMVFYWICYLKKTLLELPIGNHASINDLMAKKCLNDGYSWFEYFWDSLDDQDRVTAAINVLGKWHDAQFQDGEWVIENAPSCRFQKRLMSKMTVSQQNQLLSEIYCNIIFNFWLGNEPEWAFKVWMRVKHQFTIAEFGNLVYRILQVKMRFERDVKVLIDVWNTADDHLKSNITHWDKHIMDIFAFYYQRTGFSFTQKHSSKLPAPSCYKFLYHYLSAKDVDFRVRRMEYVVDFLAHDLGDFLLEGDLLKLYSSDEEKLSKFKKYVLELSSVINYGTNLAIQMQFAKLFVLLTIYSTDKNVTRNFVNEILKSNETNKAKFIVCHTKWIKFSEFIDKMFRNDDENDSVSSSTIKKGFIASFVTDYCHILLKNENMNDFTEIVESVYTIEELPEVKNMVLVMLKKSSHSIKFWRNFDENNFRTLIWWCLNDETEIDNFKRTLPIDDIFNKFLNKICNSESNTHDRRFDVLNKCFVWYFGGTAEAKEYKVRKMYEFDNALVSEIFRKFPKVVWKKCLSRLFDDDLEAVRKFRLEYVKYLSEKKVQSAT